MGPPTGEIHLAGEVFGAGDVEFLVSHGKAEAIVLDAASWAIATLAVQRAPERRRDVSGPLPVVAVADRLRAIRLFEFVSVDELFRVAASARQTRYDRGHVLATAGQPPADAQRPPLNLSVVLDRSGSMQGEKLAAAKAANRQRSSRGPSAA